MTGQIGLGPVAHAGVVVHFVIIKRLGDVADARRRVGGKPSPPEGHHKGQVVGAVADGFIKAQPLFQQKIHREGLGPHIVHCAGAVKLAELRLGIAGGRSLGRVGAHLSPHVVVAPAYQVVAGISQRRGDGCQGAGAKTVVLVEKQQIPPFRGGNSGVARAGNAGILLVDDPDAAVLFGKCIAQFSAFVGAAVVDEQMLIICKALVPHAGHAAGHKRHPFVHRGQNGEKRSCDHRRCLLFQDKK